MILLRSLLVALLVACSLNAHSQLREVGRLVPGSVAVGEAAWTPFILVFDDGAGNPAVGHAFTWQTEPGCGTFEEGFQSAGVTDENGRAVSSTFSGVAQDLGCKVWFFIDGTSDWRQLVRVYDPATVVMVPQATNSQTLTDFDYELWIYMQDPSDGMGVAEGPPAVLEIGTSQSGATAVATGSACYYNVGLCTMKFRSNGRAGTYPVTFGHNQQALTVSVKQRHN
jgi:hypothetical protein